MASLTDWFARTFFIDADLERDANERALVQQQILDRQYAEDKRDTFEYARMTGEIRNTGTNFFDQQLGKSGTAGLPGLAFSYWWIWAAIGLGIFFYFGGFAWLKKRFRFA